ncbi:MAG: class I SAM-dependent methyltransferase [Armatimonadota bacterium]
MDSIIATNRERWNALADAHVMHSLPFLEFTREDAAGYVYRHDFITDVAGKRVLCLASGGGQDSVAFGLLGATVTVFDLSDVQLARDREGAAHHGLQVVTVQGDMRDLSMFADDAFDVVWQPYSLNFCPEVVPVFREVARVLRAGGFYHLSFANPFTQSIDNDWDGAGYRLRGRYTDGEDIRHYYPPMWEVEQPDGSVINIPRPHEFRHTFSRVLNTMAQQGFIFLHLTEWMRHADPLEPGSWPHFTQCAPPYMYSYWRRGEK